MTDELENPNGESAGFIELAGKYLRKHSQDLLPQHYLLRCHGFRLTPIRSKSERKQLKIRSIYSENGSCDFNFLTWIYIDAEHYTHYLRCNGLIIREEHAEKSKIVFNVDGKWIQSCAVQLFTGKMMYVRDRKSVK